MWGSNLIVNGGFDGTTYNEVFGGVTDVLPTGWMLMPPEVESQTDANVVASSVFPAFPDPDNGGFYFAFEAPAPGGGQDCLFQDVSTVPGQSYILTFWAAITSASNSGLELYPEWDATGSNDMNLPINGFNTNNGESPAFPNSSIHFEQFSFTETASLSTTRIFFHGEDTTGAILLDDVSLDSAAPEPGSFGLIAVGICLVGLGLVKRKQIDWARCVKRLLASSSLGAC